MNPAYETRLYATGGARTALPVALCRDLGVIPLRFADGHLEVAAPRELQLPELDDLERAAGCPATVTLAAPETLREALADHLNFLELVEAAVAERDGAMAILTDRLIDEAVTCGASDLHLEPGPNHTTLRVRLDGRLRLLAELPSSLHDGLTSRLKLSARMDIAERRRPQDGRMVWRQDDFDLDVRVSTLPTLWGEKVAMRLLAASRALRLDELGCDEMTERLLTSLARSNEGLVLSTGPTGSGKTTTQYAMLQAVDRRTLNVVTAEDPIEYRLEGVNQVGLNEAAGATFPTILRAMLRQDPDVVMVGEIRDGETAELAVRAALTGHLVFSTLHTADAVSALWRLVDMGVPPWLVAASVRAVVAQRLLRRLCPACRRPLERPVHAGLTAQWEAPGCSRCDGTGHRGRVAVFETLVVDRPLRERMTGREPLSALRGLMVQWGLPTLRARALELVERGVTSLEEALSCTPSPDE